ncbi:UbiA prenyltransferase [Solidesulfovibrio carbinoliphilus subsp. oakridgensis]|uniref:UbiA prenyltransferase n=1 Tax=Solidesulfovibrio carbinoliphilus subsp. oakridgensis TaxID=694327 RepID=G7Q8U0_9BACT|nr:UbiA family prenyltransferase [Solidesulfovibrio carbinoliphilus]EHJ47426.1 UbiA prenyltransferase [Solidesulfovibrio carbinoliphilus subsp. oakridgensis]
MRPTDLATHGSPHQPATPGRFALTVYLALSRTPHGLLDLATPFCAALLCGGGLPSAGIIALGCVTVFAGYTAVYALNDIVDYRSDKKQMENSGEDARCNYLDAAFIRHPLAHGCLTLPEAVLWFVFWAIAAFVGAYSLNPVCAWILIAGCVLETAYCLLLTVTHLRAAINGVVKALGPLAASFAVNPHPSPWFLAGLFAWVFAWEIGGQNIPADWHDASRDAAFGARTMPVVLGYAKASRLAVACLIASLLLSMPLLALSPLAVSAPLWLAAAVLGAILVLPPAAKLVRSQSDADAAALFNRASCYPALVLVVLVVHLLVR